MRNGEAEERQNPRKGLEGKGLEGWGEEEEIAKAIWSTFFNVFSKSKVPKKFRPSKI